jgi:hypothetical protein
MPAHCGTCCEGALQAQLLAEIADKVMIDGRDLMMQLVATDRKPVARLSKKRAIQAIWQWLPCQSVHQ